MNNRICIFDETDNRIMIKEENINKDDYKHCICIDRKELPIKENKEGYVGVYQANMETKEIEVKYIKTENEISEIDKLIKDNNKLREELSATSDFVDFLAGEVLK